jgi:hypothetical protein
LKEMLHDKVRSMTAAGAPSSFLLRLRRGVTSVIALLAELPCAGAVSLFLLLLLLLEAAESIRSTVRTTSLRPEFFDAALLGTARGVLFAGVGGAGGSTTRRDVLPRMPSAAKLSVSALFTDSVLTALRRAKPVPSRSSSDRR